MLPATTATYREYVESQMQTLLGQQGDKLWAFWKSQMIAPLPVLHLPTDRPRPPSLTHEGSAHIIEISQDVMQGVSSLCSTFGVTVYGYYQHSKHFCPATWPRRYHCWNTWHVVKILDMNTLLLCKSCTYQEIYQEILHLKLC